MGDHQTRFPGSEGLEIASSLPGTEAAAQPWAFFLPSTAKNSACPVSEDGWEQHPGGRG